MFVVTAYRFVTKTAAFSYTCFFNSNCNSKFIEDCSAWVYNITLWSEFTNIENKNEPPNIVNMVKNLPCQVLGNISPYPTVGMVINDHHKQFPN
jgi:hypothetical protein